MHLPVNTLLQGGKYRIVRFISSGGFGCTYEAEHVLLEKRVAIKEFFVKDFCNRDETTSHVTVGTVSKTGLVDKLRRKFIDEARALCKLQHSGIVSVSDVFEENGTAYYVMDYVRGRSLSDIVNREGPIPEDRAVGYIRQVASALQYVHDNNRLHLDIKPGNIMIDGGDNPVLIDFGASKQYDEVDGENTSTLLGKTPGYAPPEQMSNSVVKFLPATDIYALGATLYKILTGVTPLDANLRISGEELDPLPANIGPATRNAVAAAMEINKSKRPQTLAAFVKLLDSPSEASENESTVLEAGEKTLVAEEVDPGRAEKQSPPLGGGSAKPAPTFWERYRRVVVGVAVVVGVVVGFLLFQHRRGAEDRLVSEVVSDSVLQDSLTGVAGVRSEAVDTVSSAALLAAQREQEEQARLAEEQRSKAEEAERQRLAGEQRKKEEAAAALQRERQRIIDLFDMVYVEGGTFTMGATSEQGSDVKDNEKPAHSVTLSSYYIGKYEVTQKQWVEIMGSNPSHFEGDNLPVEMVSWNDVQVFLRRLNAKTGKRYRLPTEAEWEYAARGGNRSRGYKYSGSNDIGTVAWYDNSTHPVGSKLPNELGIYDMTGNVKEFCSDRYGDYSSTAQTNPQGPAAGTIRVVRGDNGGIRSSGDYRVLGRMNFPDSWSSNFLGFRLALSL